MEKTYTKAEVKTMLREVIETYGTSEQLDMEFEEWLNNDGKNGNNGDNEHLREYFEDDLIESFII